MSLDPVIAPNAALLREMIDDVALQGEGMMDRVLAQSRRTLQLQAENAASPAERELLEQTVRFAFTQAQQLVASYPQALREGFAAALANKPTQIAGSAPVKFDQLELMDDRVVQDQVEIARGLQQAVAAVESELGEFNALICAVLGLKQVQAGRNPIAPGVFVGALRKVLVALGADNAATLRLGHAMGPELGQELRKLYSELKTRLLVQGIKPAEFTVLRTPEGAGKGAHFGKRPAGGADAEVLTIHQLKRLLSSQLSGASDALASPLGAHVNSTVTVQDQQLGQEVVDRMVSNISQNPRLLPAVQQMVRRLEPALMRMALSDPRFLSDKTHPARRLLEETVHRSFEFESDQAAGFSSFLDQVNQSVSQLDQFEVVDAQPFSKALERLRSGWAASDQHRQKKQEEAKQALLRAEQRNTLASELAVKILNRSDIERIPTPVVIFVTGPWVQVMAHARINLPTPLEVRVDYEDLMEKLIWSVQPELATKSLPKLIKLIPSLLAGLRQGLQLINFPQNETEYFFDELIGLHERSINPNASPMRRAKAAPESASTSTPAASLSARPVGLVGSGTPWLAPQEASDSGYIDNLGGTEDSAAETDFAPTDLMSMPMGLEASPPPDAPDLVAQLQVGDWVELFALGQWMQAELTWATPQGSMYLFTALGGRTHSMTRRLLDTMHQQERIRLFDPSTVVDQALDSVAQAAMSNSVFMGLQDEAKGSN